MSNKGVGSVAVGLLILIALVVVFVPVISEHIAVADDQRACTNALYPYECLDNDDGLLNWCSNESDGTLRCTNASYPVYNATYELCTNTSGVGVVNISPISVCDSTGWADGIVAYEDVGLSATETALLWLVILILVLSVLFVVVKETGLTNKN